METGLLRRWVPGQTLVLIALLLLVLFAFIGLSVDVGHAYGRQRTDQHAANAAALAGMNAYLRGGQVPANVRQAIYASLESNKVVHLNSSTSFQEYGKYAPSGGAAPLSGYTTIWAEFLDEDFNKMRDIGNTNATVPDVKYIRVTVIDPVDTYFARLVGRETLTVNAEGLATSCKAVRGIYPFTFDINKLRMDYGDVRSRFKRIGTEIWTPLELDNGNVGWGTWLGSPNARTLGAAWSGSGSLDDGFLESEVDTFIDPSTGDGFQRDIYRGDQNRTTEFDDFPVWMDAAPGLMASNDMEQALEQHRVNGTELILPLHSTTNPDYGQSQTERHCTGQGPRRRCEDVDYTYGIWGDKADQQDPVREAGGSHTAFKILGLYKFRLVAFKQSNGATCHGDLAHCANGGNGNVTCDGVVRDGNKPTAGLCWVYLGPLDQEQARACTVGG